MKLFANASFSNDKIIAGENSAPGVISLIASCNDEKVKNKNLKVRSWVYGDSFQPLGMHGKKKVSDFLIDNKIDCFEKQSQLVLTANDDIIWLCGQRISDKVKVTKNTSTMMELSYEKYVQL